MTSPTDEKTVYCPHLWSLTGLAFFCMAVQQLTKTQWANVVSCSAYAMAELLVCIFVVELVVLFCVLVLHSFYPRGASDARVIAIIASVCVCVCLSVTRRCCIKTAKRRITQTTPSDSPGTLIV